ncbi:MAG: sodium:calcium antiporter [Marivita sp.]|uniref:sodium:calcium antiporter n=1 Tax=Marivita sp. TaxID=2003365 RepID=UPI0025C661D7|nr:sodium:calcium antiporter [Marivita sp.]MCI5112908.1 sodium:calcium antiporter [Marivita sp.]
MNLILVAFGLVALLAGGDLLVRGAVGVARRLGVSPLVIGLTLVGFGTSAPELVTSVSAVGLAVLAMLGQISVLAGITLLALLGTYLWGAFRSAAAPDHEPGLPTDPLPKAATFLMIGLALTLGGAIALVDGATGIARAYGVPETVIGLTLVAVGTSLPELATTVMAARRGQSDVALGNILGSGIFNILGILGVTALVTPLPVDAALLPDIAVMLATTALLLGLLFWRRGLGRISGLVFLLTYAAYMAWLSQTF